MKSDGKGPEDVKTELIQLREENAKLRVQLHKHAVEQSFQFDVCKFYYISTLVLHVRLSLLFRVFVCLGTCIQCIHAVGWVMGRASSL